MSPPERYRLIAIAIGALVALVAEAIVYVAPIGNMGAAGVGIIAGLVGSQLVTAGFALADETEKMEAAENNMDATQ